LTKTLYLFMKSTQNRKHVITFSMNVSKNTPLITFQKGGKRERNERRRQVQPSSNIGRTLQDFTVLSTETFRRCVIRSLSMIFLPTLSPTDYVRRLYLRWWFPIPSLYRSEKQKNHLPMVLQTKFARQKKKIPAWNIPTDFYSVGILWLTDGQ
jgi:hypothetical protein